MTILTALGLMSGTSMDGIDVALLRSDGRGHVERGPNAEYPYSPEMREAIARGLEDARMIRMDRLQRPGDLINLERELTKLHASAVRAFLEETGMRDHEIDVIGFHGQTVLHRPHEGLTVQIGFGPLLARLTGIDVVFDLRARDMALGGQGAPLVPVYHQALAGQVARLAEPRRSIAFVNIGGIANITHVGVDGELVAFDTGPGNALIDQWVMQGAGIPYDQGGRIASEGTIVAHVAERYLASPFFAAPVPKSLDRNDFLPPAPDEMQLADGARTLANVTARAIWAACDHLPDLPGLMIMCGGGRRNETIIGDLKALAEPRGVSVVSAEEAGLDGGAMEAEAFAYLAIRSMQGLPLTFPTTTGCREPVSGGVFAPVRSIHRN